MSSECRAELIECHAARSEMSFGLSSRRHDRISWLTSICHSCAREQDIGIADGKFVAIGPNLAGSAREEIDAIRLSIFPGVIDAHVHFNEPGRTDWEGFETGSRAAAAGGTTTIFDMPLNAHPPTIDGPSFDAKRAAGRKEFDGRFRSVGRPCARKSRISWRRCVIAASSA